MASTNKPRVIKDYDKLDKEVKDLIKATYPQGFAEKLIQYPNKDGMLVSALPFETEDKMYLVRINNEEVKIVYADTEDYDEVDDEIKENELNADKIEDLEAEASDEDDFEEKYAEEKTFGPGIEDDGEDDDDEEDEENYNDDDLDDDDIDDDVIDTNTPKTEA
ncbi:MAG: hypothetical protein II394_09280, partial [Bacteroidales bacterium]|nr:hypothetical protein [Bacteroidales bacterium]